MVIFLVTNNYILFGYYWSKMVIHVVFNGFILLIITNVEQIHYMNIGMIKVCGERVFTGLGSISCSILSILQTRGWLFRIGQYQHHPAWEKVQLFQNGSFFREKPIFLGFTASSLLHI